MVSFQPSQRGKVRYDVAILRRLVGRDRGDRGAGCRRLLWADRAVRKATQARRRSPAGGRGPCACSGGATGSGDSGGSELESSRGRRPLAERPRRTISCSTALLSSRSCGVPAPDDHEIARLRRMYARQLFVVVSISPPFPAFSSPFTGLTRLGRAWCGGYTLRLHERSSPNRRPKSASHRGNAGAVCYRPHLQ
jgi:hypothetical protein